MTNNSMPVFIVFFFCFVFTEARAQVSTVQALDFGNYIVIDNSSQYDITINPDGSSSFDPAGFVIISGPSEGIYDITTSQLNQAVASVVVSQHQPLLAPGNSFQLLNFQEQHDPTTDGSGVVRVIVGATARSTGSGSTYADQTYSGSIDIQINF